MMLRLSRHTPAVQAEAARIIDAIDREAAEIESWRDQFVQLVADHLRKAPSSILTDLEYPAWEDEARYMAESITEARLAALTGDRLAAEDDAAGSVGDAVYALRLAS